MPPPSPQQPTSGDADQASGLPGDLDQRFAVIIDRWRGPLVGLLTAWRVHDPQVLAEDVFAEFWLGRKRYRGSWADSGAAGGWLRGIAWNLVRAERRRAARAPRGITEDVPGGGTTQPEQEAMRSERGAAIRAAIEALPDDQRTVVYMRLMEGTPGRDVAAFLGISERAVEGRLRRARIELTRVLADGHTDEAAASRPGSEEEVVS